MINKIKKEDRLMNIRVCGVNELVELHKNFDPTHIITLIDPYVKVDYHKTNSHKLLRLDMFDIETTRYPGHPTAEHVNKIIDFAQNTDPETSRVIVHCKAGISRSTAAALTIMYIWSGYDVKAAEEALKAIRPEASPNKLICKLADELLGNTKAELWKVSQKMDLYPNLKAMASLDGI